MLVSFSTSDTSTKHVFLTHLFTKNKISFLKQLVLLLQKYVLFSSTIQQALDDFLITYAYSLIGCKSQSVSSFKYKKY
jgi:hypothetical protein